MILNKFFRLYAPEPDAGGTDTEAPVDRGDTLVPPDQLPIEPVVVAEDPAVKALDADLTSKLDEKKTDDADADEHKKRDVRIPLARHEAILQKERDRSAALAAQLAARDTAQRTTEVNTDIVTLDAKIATLEAEYATLLTDNEPIKAAAVMAQIRAANRQIAEASSDVKLQAAVATIAETSRYNTALDRVEASYPALNPDHTDYDEALVADVLELKAAFQVTGLTPTLALQKAVRTLAGAETGKQEDATTVVPRAEKGVGAERKKDAVAKVVGAVGKTPASLSGVGLDGDKMGGGALDGKAVMDMSQKEFAALSEATLAQLRGDTL